MPMKPFPPSIVKKADRLGIKLPTEEELEQKTRKQRARERREEEERRERRRPVGVQW